MSDIEEKKSALVEELDGKIFFVHLEGPLDGIDEETKFPDFVEERIVPSNGTCIYAFKLGDLREYVEEVGCPTAGRYYLDWLVFARLLRNEWMGEQMFVVLMKLWKLIL
jgi:hypothetical protein